MTIIRSKVSQDFTFVRNNAIHDIEFDSKYIGTFLRLISKSENWEISVAGLAKMYPTNGLDYYRNALKHMCKLGYLIRIPQPRVKGQFQKVLMELYDTRQIEKPLSDEDVEALFGKEDLSEEEIQKIYPNRVSRHGVACEVNPTQQRTKEPSSYSTYKKTKEKNNNRASPKPAAAVAVFPFLKDKDRIPEFEKEWLSRNYNEEEVSKALAYAESPNTVIKKSFMATLKWACRIQPEIPQNNDPEIRCKDNYDKAREILGDLDGKRLKTNNGVEMRFEICRKYLEIVGSGKTWKIFDFKENDCISQIMKCLNEYFPSLKQKISLV